MAIDWKAMKRMLDRDSLLKQVGLEDRTPGSDFLTGLGLFSVGVLVGAGLGLLFAPDRGRETRARVYDAWRRKNPGKLADVAQDIGAEAGVPSSTMGH